MKLTRKILSLVFLLLHLVASVFTENVTENLNITKIFKVRNNSEINHRNSRQLFSLLKNFIQSQNKPWTKQEPSIPQQSYYPANQNQPLNQYSHMNNPYQQQPIQQYAQEKIQYGGSVESVVNNDNELQQPTNQNVQYPMLNYQTSQHSSVPLYNENLQSMQNYKIQQTHPQQGNPGIYNSGSSTNGFGAIGGGGLGSLLSAALKSPNGIGSSLSNGNQILTKLGLPGIPEDLDVSSLVGLVNFGNFEGILTRVNQFDKLQCIPRMICQMVAKRNEDVKLRESTSTTTTTTTTTTERSKKNKKKESSRDARFLKFKFNGVDTALDQFVKFLDMMQMKDWSLYPYIKGMSEGNQVSRSTDCADKFNSCPFAEDQLVYYFNNYNGGFFQSVRSSRQLNETISEITSSQFDAKSTQ